jgi:outer membrane protein assembly factor BamD (BamD/ComL family)
LLYYQVEKTQKEQPLGYEAKLRNAKVSYYKGEFELAKEHLDVLKIATTREIANDALYLSLLIRDNLIEDSTGALLSSYSGISLLLYQNKYQQALDSLQAMLIQYPNSTLTDDIYFEQAKIYRKIGQFDSAIEALKFIMKNFPDEMITDDALMLLANIYDEDLKEKEKAKEVYQTIFVNYPNSVFSDQARKRFRTLRGDKI